MNKLKPLNKTYTYKEGNAVLVHDFILRNDGTIELYTGTPFGMHHSFNLEVEENCDMEYSILKPANKNIGMTWKYLELVSKSLKQYLEDIQDD